MRETLREKRGSGGFTLVELLITIVIVGILAAVVVVAIGGLTNSGEKSACQATADAANAAATAYYSDHNSTWPTDFTQLYTSGGTANYLTPRAGVTVAAASISNGSAWSLPWVAPGADGPNFVCP